MDGLSVDGWEFKAIPDSEVDWDSLPNSDFALSKKIVIQEIQGTQVAIENLLRNYAIPPDVKIKVIK